MADPGHLAGGGQLVEERGLVVGDPARQDQRLPRGGGRGVPGELVDHLEQAVDTARAAPWPVDVLPGEQEPAERRRLDRLDLAAEPGQGASAQEPEHLGVAPLRARARRSELPLENPPLGAEPLQGLPDDGGTEAEPGGDVGDR